MGKLRSLRRMKMRILGRKKTGKVNNQKMNKILIGQRRRPLPLIKVRSLEVREQRCKSKRSIT